MLGTGGGTATRQAPQPETLHGAIYGVAQGRPQLNHLAAAAAAAAVHRRQEDPLKKEMATGSSILAWEITWTEEPGGFTVHRVAKDSDMT